MLRLVVGVPIFRAGWCAGCAGLVAPGQRGLLATARGAALRPDRARRPSRTACVLDRRRGLRRLGRGAPAQRGRVGIRSLGRAVRRAHPWGEQEPDETRFHPCNIWQGDFPRDDTGADGHVGTAPVDAFAPNGFGLFNTVGNVWEWCADAFRIRSLSQAAKRRNTEARAAGMRLLKGGSYLCHRSYCHRYRIAARTGAGADSATGHVGFRLVFDLA